MEPYLRGRCGRSRRGGGTGGERMRRGLGFKKGRGMRLGFCCALASAALDFGRMAMCLPARHKISRPLKAPRKKSPGWIHIGPLTSLIHTFQFFFSIGTVFFSHNKLAEIVF